MDNKECARLLIEMYSDYCGLSEKHESPIVVEYSEAVAMAIMAMMGRAEDGK